MDKEEIKKKINELRSINVEILELYVETGDVEYAKTFINNIEFYKKNAIEVFDEELFFKDIDGKCLMDYIVENGLLFNPFNIGLKIANSPHILFKYPNYVLDEFFLKINILEDTLFEEIDGISVFESLLKNDCRNIEDIISKIENHPEIVELLVKYNKQDYLGKITEKIMFGRMSDGKLVIEYLFETDCLSWRNLYNIKEHPEIVLMCIKYNKINKLNSINETILFKKINDKQLVIEYLFENNYINKIIIGNIRLYPEIVNICINNNRIDLFESLTEDVLFSENDNGKLVIEHLFENDYVTPKIINKILFNEEIVSLCIKYNRIDLLTSVKEKMLFTKMNENQLVIEYLFENNLVSAEIINKIYNHAEIIKLCEKYNRKDLIDFVSSSLYTEQIREDYTVLEYLLDNNYNVKGSHFYKESLLDILYKKSRFDLICYSDISTLLKLCDINKTYLDLLLDEYNNNPNMVDITKISFSTTNTKETAQKYIIFAKHNLVKVLSNLKKIDLLNNNGELMHELMNYDKDLVMQVIPIELQNDIEISMLLKLYGVETKNIDLSIDRKRIASEYLENVNNQADNNKLSMEIEALLDEFKSLMLADNKSDKELVDNLIRNYRNLISKNHPYALNELIHLINIKKNNPNFVLRKTDDGAYYSPMEKSVNLDDISFGTMNHEFGHVYFDLVADNEIPNEYSIIIEKLRNDKQVLKNVMEYSKKFKRLKKEVEEYVEKTYMEKYDKQEKNIDEIKEYLETEKQKTKEKYKDRYSEEELEVLLSKRFTVTEYLKQDRRIQKEELVDSILRQEYAAFIAIGDIIDAIYEGRFKSNVLKNEKGEIIESAYGHGVNYYSSLDEKKFNETIANYSSIIKSDDGKEILDVLRGIVGDELVDLIVNYYEKNIVMSTKYNKGLNNNEREELVL